MAYKVFTNGSPLPASDLNTYLMNQSVMVFADSAARTAALSTPTEGMVTWLEDTNALEAYNGATWNAVGGSTGASWVSISSGNITTGSTTFSLTSLPAYDKYWLAFANISSANASSQIRITINSDSGSNYIEYGTQLKAASTYAIGNFGTFASSSSTYFLSAILGNNASADADGSIYIEGGKSSGRKRVLLTGGGSNNTDFWQFQTQGIWNNTAAITSLQIVSSSGNIDAGTYELWGSN